MTEQLHRGVGHGFRTARVFDGTAKDGRPHVDRQMLDETEAGRVLAYLESAPVVHAVEAYGLDRVDPGRGRAVPLTWHTDGTWVWPGAVTYYLRSYALPPDTEFLAHIRHRNFQSPIVRPETKQAAADAVVSGAGHPGGSAIASEPGGDPERAATDVRTEAGRGTDVRPGARMAEGRTAEARAEAGMADARVAEGRAAETGMAEARASNSIEAAPNAAPAMASGAFIGDSRTITPARPSSRPAATAPAATAPPATVPAAGAPAPAATGTPPPRADDSASFDRLRAAAVELGLSTRAYRVGAGAEGAWSVLREGSEWAVFRTEHGARREHATFATSQQATAYLIGQLYLSRALADAPAEDRPEAAPQPAEAAGVAQPRSAPPRPAREMAEPPTGHTAGPPVPPAAAESQQTPGARQAEAPAPAPTDEPARAAAGGVAPDASRLAAPAAGPPTVRAEPAPAPAPAAVPRPTGPTGPPPTGPTGGPRPGAPTGPTGGPQPGLPTGPTGGPRPAEQAPGGPRPAGPIEPTSAETTRAMRPGTPTEQAPGRPTGPTRPTDPTPAEPAGGPRPAGPTGGPRPAESAGGPRPAEPSGGPRPSGPAEPAPGEPTGRARPEPVPPQERSTFQGEPPSARPTAEQRPAPERGDRPASMQPSSPAAAAAIGAAAAAMSPARSAAEAPPVPRPHAAPSAPSPASAHGVTPQGTPKDVSPRADQEQRTAAATSGTAQQAGQQWKIQPLPGEPPLTLYRDKRMVVLPPGTEVDRYGEANGNVTYAARTQYPHRSLPTDWSSFPYHVYRLQRPLEALTGLAVPWFEQPGGGTAFVLPRSISELMADGSLVEIEEAAAPGRSH